MCVCVCVLQSQILLRESSQSNTEDQLYHPHWVMDSDIHPCGRLGACNLERAVPCRILTDLVRTASLSKNGSWFFRIGSVCTRSFLPFSVPCAAKRPLMKTTLTRIITNPLGAVHLSPRKAKLHKFYHHTNTLRILKLLLEFVKALVE